MHNRISTNSLQQLLHNTLTPTIFCIATGSGLFAASIKFHHVNQTFGKYFQKNFQATNFPFLQGKNLRLSRKMSQKINIICQTRDKMTSNSKRINKRDTR